MKQLNLRATEERKAHILQRRVHVNALKRSNYVWHVDGYDKLKPFGFFIHGCIDGYSRRIMWLQVASNNNNPAIIAKYYLDCLKHFNIAPRVLRAYKGTKNSRLSFLQPFFRDASADRTAGLKSFINGKSTSENIIMLEDPSKALNSLVDRIFQGYKGFRNIQFLKSSNERMSEILFHECFAIRFGQNCTRLRTRADKWI